MAPTARSPWPSAISRRIWSTAPHLAELLAESMMTGCRITLTGRWATVQIEDLPDYRHRLGELAEARRMLLLDGFEHPEEHPERGQPRTAATNALFPDDPWAQQ
jgi:hypothetical protein